MFQDHNQIEDYMNQTSVYMPFCRINIVEYFDLYISRLSYAKDIANSEHYPEIM